MKKSELKQIIKEELRKVLNESHIDDDMLYKITKLPAYRTLRKDFTTAVSKFTNSLDKVADEIGYDEGDNDHNLAFNTAIQDALSYIIDMESEYMD